LKKKERMKSTSNDSSNAKGSAGRKYHNKNGYQILAQNRVVQKGLGLLVPGKYYTVFGVSILGLD